MFQFGISKTCWFSDTESMSRTILDWKKGNDEENEEVEVKTEENKKKIRRYLTIVIAPTVQKHDLPQYLRFPVYTDRNGRY